MRVGPTWALVDLSSALARYAQILLHGNSSWGLRTSNLRPP